jgi:hypothetical protein
MDECWEKAIDLSLLQGDLITECYIIRPIFTAPQEAEILPPSIKAEAHEFDVIIVTQSCDLENRKVKWVTTCPIFTLETFKEYNPSLNSKSKLNEIASGRYLGYYLLRSPTNPSDIGQCLIVDFRQVFSLPIEYLEYKVQAITERWRLKTPYLEHFSQAFAQLFERVALPTPPIRF